MKIGRVRCESCRECGPCIIGSGEEEDACMRRQGWVVEGDVCLCPECAHALAQVLAAVVVVSLPSAP